MKEQIYNSESQLRSLPVLFGKMKDDIKASNELGFRLAVRNISATYRQSVLGFVWALLPPVFSAAVFYLLKRGGVTNTNLEVSYGAWLVAGTFLWQSFADAILGQMRSFAQSKQMLSKINFARESIVVAGVYETLFNLGVRLVVLIPMLLLFGISFSTSVLYFPLGILVMLLVGTLCGLVLGPLGLVFQDIERALPLILPLLMILSGVVIPFPREGLLGVLEAYNPLAIGVNFSRQALLGMELTTMGPALLAAALLALFSLAGWILFRLTIPHVTSRIPA